MWEIPLYAMIGLAVGLAAPRLAPRRFADRWRLAALTGAGAGAVGGMVTHTVLSGAFGFELLAALLTAVVLVAVTARPDGDAPGAVRRAGVTPGGRGRTSAGRVPR